MMKVELKDLDGMILLNDFPFATLSAGEGGYRLSSAVDNLLKPGVNELAVRVDSVASEEAYAEATLYITADDEDPDAEETPIAAVSVPAPAAPGVVAGQGPVEAATPPPWSAGRLLQIESDGPQIDGILRALHGALGNGDVAMLGDLMRVWVTHTGEAHGLGGEATYAESLNEASVVFSRPGRVLAPYPEDGARFSLHADGRVAFTSADGRAPVIRSGTPGADGYVSIPLKFWHDGQRWHAAK